MRNRNLGLAIVVLGGLVFLTAVGMGLLGIPHHGWGIGKLGPAAAGLLLAAAGFYLVERSHRNDAPDPGRTGRLFVYAAVFDAALSVFPRLPFMNHITSWWRSSHTLLSALWFQKEGINLLHYQTPVYGPPFEVPLEFPLYQAVCAVFAGLTRIDLTLASRMVSLGIFYLVALLLVLLCLEFLESRSLTLVILTVFLWLPFNIRYSTEILPDYLSVLLALAFLYGIRRWSVRPGSAGAYAATVVLGCLGAMVKITTMPIIAVAAALVALDGMRGWGIDLRAFFSRKGFLPEARKHFPALLMLAGLAALPLIAEVLWVRWEDYIKEANLYARYLTSANSGDWYYGTWAQKLSYTEWAGKLDNWKNDFLLGVAAAFAFPVLGMVFLDRMPVKTRAVFGSALTGTVLAIFCFFNLYLHEYYFISVAASASVMIGFGIHGLYRFVLQRNAWRHVFAGIAFLALALAGVEQMRFIRGIVDKEILYTQQVMLPAAQKVDAWTPEGEYVILLQFDWYPDVLFFSERKGLILTPREDGKFTCDTVTPYPYTTILILDRDPQDLEKLGLLKCFGTATEVEPGVYKVGK
jgi:hypothetical protein